MENNELLKLYLEEARKYIGTPFRHQGRDFNGLDCIGIIVVPLKNLDLIDTNEDSTKYKRYGLSKELVHILEKYCIEVNKADMQPGDILLFSKQNSQHLAIYTGDSIIHSNNIIGKVVEHGLDDNVLELVSKVFRYDNRGLKV
jgi:cell wall-associated NlpC family hydrolase